MTEQPIVRQLLIRVDEFLPGTRLAGFDLESKPDQVWIHVDRGVTEPVYHERCCPTCGSADHFVGAIFCQHDGARLELSHTSEFIPFDRGHGYWMDVGHDWRWMSNPDGPGGRVRINNPGLEMPGFWVICNYLNRDEG